MRALSRLPATGGRLDREVAVADTHWNRAVEILRARVDTSVKSLREGALAKVAVRRDATAGVK